MAVVRPDPLEKPPDYVKDLYKFYKKLPKNEISPASDIVDFHVCKSEAGLLGGFWSRNNISKNAIKSACSYLEAAESANSCSVDDKVVIYEHPDIPGKFPQCKE